MVFLLTLLGLFSAENAQAARGWTCSASGYETGIGGMPGRRREVHGTEMPTQAAAEARAMQVCMGSGLSGCLVSACSQLPFFIAD